MPRNIPAQHPIASYVPKPPGILDNEDVHMERTIEVGGLSDELLSRLDERANQIGVDRSSYIRRLIERAFAPHNSMVPLADLWGPVHDYPDLHGMAGEEIERFFSDQLTDARRQRRKIDEGE